MVSIIIEQAKRLKEKINVYTVDYLSPNLQNNHCLFATTRKLFVLHECIRICKRFKSTLYLT